MSYNPRSFRMFLTSSVSAAMIASVVAPVLPINVVNAEAASSNFSDVNQDAYYAEAVQYLVEKGVLDGYQDGTFKPNKFVTRAEAAKIMAELLGLETVNASEPNFADIPTGSWYSGYVSALVDAGIIDGYQDGTFKPNKTITRAEMAKLLVVAFDELEVGSGTGVTFKDVKADAWYSVYVSALVEKGITTGTTATTFSPNSEVKRGQAAAFMYRTDRIKEEAPIVTIEEVTSSQITVNGKMYVFSEELKGLFNEENAEALQGASIRFALSDNVITEVSYLELTNEGTANNNFVLDAKDTTIDGDVKVSANYLSIQNLTVTGNLELTSKVENGFDSTKLTVGGSVNITDSHIFAASLTVLNQSNKTITFDDADLNTINVDKKDTNIELTGETTVKKIFISANASISASNKTIIPSVVVLKGAEAVEINATVTNVSVETGEETTITGKGNIEVLAVKGSTTLNLKTTGEIGDIELPTGERAEDVINNFNEAKKNIEQINGDRNPSYSQPSRGSGGSSGGSNTQLVSAISLGDITVNNAPVNGQDSITIKNLAAGDIVKVYSSATEGSVLHTVTATGSTETIATTHLAAAGGNLWISVQKSGRTESPRVKKTYYADDVIVYDEAGTYGPADGQPIQTIDGDVVIDGDDVILQNTIITGNLIISESVGEGESRLRNVTVQGTTTVAGGGINSIYFIDSVLATVIVNKNNGTIRIVAEGNTNVAEVVLESTVKIEESNLTGHAAGFTDITLSDNLQSVNPDLKVELVGQFDTINSRAVLVRIDLAENTSVESLILNAATSVFGEGSIRSVEVNANGSTIQQRPQEVVINIPTEENQGIEIGGGIVTESHSDILYTDLKAITVTQSYIALDLQNFVNGVTLDDFEITATLGDVALDENELAALNLEYDENLKMIRYTPLLDNSNAGSELSFTIAPLAAPAQGEDTRKIRGTEKTGSVTLGTGASGRITDIYGAAATNATLTFRLATGGATSNRVTTDKHGFYSAELAPGTYVGVISGTGYIDTEFLVTVTTDVFVPGQDATAIRAAASNSFKVMLSWNGAERDLDSHMIGPTTDGEGFHTFFGQKVYERAGIKYVDLDWDDTDYFGPETTTVRKWVDGRYVFYVHNYSRENPLSDSQSVVKVYQGNASTPEKTFNVPANSKQKENWAVFELFVSNNGTTFDYKPIETMISDASWLSNPRESLQEQIENAKRHLASNVRDYSPEEITGIEQLVAAAALVLNDSTATTKEVLDETEKLYEAIFTVRELEGLPEAPSVTADDENNVIINADNTMEYSTDGGESYTAYDALNPPTFEGDVTVLVRFAADEVNGLPAGEVEGLTFTAPPTLTENVTYTALNLSDVDSVNSDVVEVATVTNDVTNKQITISAVSEGTATIIAVDSDGKTATVFVTVAADGSISTNVTPYEEPSFTLSLVDGSSIAITSSAPVAFSETLNQDVLPDLSTAYSATTPTVENLGNLFVWHDLDFSTELATVAKLGEAKIVVNLIEVQPETATLTFDLDNNSAEGLQAFEANEYLTLNLSVAHGTALTDTIPVRLQVVDEDGTLKLFVSQNNL